MIGKTLSHYKIVSELGRGGMGIVYKAEDTNLDRIVAIKILPPQIVTTDEDQARFKREARAAAALNHPNIATVHDLGETEDGQTFIVMEHVGGLSLSEKLNQGPLEIETAVTLASQIAEGLSIAHQSGIVHRDVKPSNMMLTEDGRIKILDFGLAKLTGGIDITKAGSTIGTAAYMSPEQARGEEVDHRTDIWSVGVVLYEMLTGKRPFVAEYDAALAYSILNTEPESVSSIRTGVKPELEQIINRAMAKGFDERYPTMEALFEDLRTLSGSGQPVALAPSLGTLLKRPGIVVPTLIFVIFVVAFFMWRDRAGERATWARQEALPEIERLVESQSWDAAFQLALEAEKYIPNDSALIRLWPRFSDIVNIKTEPSGATFYRQPYGGSGWDEVGVTPIAELRSPFGRVNFRVEKEGYRALEWTPINWDRELTLDKEEDIPAGMVRVSGVVEEDAKNPDDQSLRLPPGLDDVKKESLQEFLIDITEVTNQEFKQFVDAGAYQSESFWGHNFVLDGHVISWEETMRLFTDRTGQPGPANWEVGDFPDGQENYPVNGLSWYEAAAYAEFVGKACRRFFIGPAPLESAGVVLLCPRAT